MENKMKKIIILSVLLSGCGLIPNAKWDGFCENQDIGQDIMWAMVSSHEEGSDYKCNQVVQLWDPISNCHDGPSLIACRRPELKGKNCIVGTDCILKDFRIGSRHVEVVCYTNSGVCNQLYLYNAISY